MKTKDQIQGENRSLKQQLAKTAEVITKVQEAEKTLLLKMVRIVFYNFLIDEGVTGASTCAYR